LHVVEAVALTADEHRANVSEDTCCASEQDSGKGTHFDVLEELNDCE
jgi:hypothetical protein